MGDSRVGHVRRNAIYLFLGVVVANLASFLFRVLLANEFGPEGFGVFSLALMTTSVATMVALLGLPDGVISFVSKYSEREECDRVIGVVVAGFGLSVGLAVILAVGVVLVAPLLSTEVFDTPRLADILWWFAWVIPANVLVDLSAAYFLGVQRGGYNTFIKQVVPKASLLLLLLPIIVLNGPLVAVGIAYLVATVFAAVVGITSVGIALPSLDRQKVTFDVRNLLTFSLPLMATSAIGLLLNWTDTVVIGHILGSRAVGIYQAAFVLAVNIHVFFGAISGSLYPNFGSLLASNERKVVSRQFKEGTRWAVLITAAPAVYLVGFPALSLETLFGSSFDEGTNVLILLVVAKALIVLFGPATPLLKAAEESRYVAVTYGVAAVANIVLNVILVPVAGIIGAAFATGVASLFGNYLHFRRIRDHFDIGLPVKPFGQALVAGAIAYTPTLLLEPYVDSAISFGFHIMGFSIVYIVALFAVGGFRIEEVRSLIADVT